jgi:hypothetical protein
MADPVLAVDLGATTTAAALVSEERAVLIPDPVSGEPVWPSLLGADGGLYLAGAAADLVRRINPEHCVEGPRRALDADTTIPLGGSTIAPVTALAAYLGSLRAEAARAGGSTVERLTTTVPATYGVPDRRRDILISAGELAGFAEVELITDTVAAATDARAAGVVPDGSVVLVCDLGETWTTALVHLDGAEPVQLAQETAPAGRDLDAMLLDDLRAQVRDWIEPRLAVPGRPAGVTRQAAIDLLRRVRHGLDEAPEITERLGDDGPYYTLSRAWLARLAEPGLRWAVASCRSLIARTSVRFGSALGGGHARPGTALGAPGGVAAVILVGRGATLPGADEILRTGLEPPVLRPADPDLAAVRGAVAWVGGAHARRVVAEHPKWRLEHLSWPVPTGRGRLVRWSVAEGAAYGRGAVVAQVRTADDLVFDLTAPNPGTLLAPLARAGEIVGPTMLVRSKRPASCLDGDPPEKRQELSAAGEWLLTPDRTLLVECASGARHVRVWSIPDGAVVGDFQPTFSDFPQQGRVFVSPDGRPQLVAWSAAGAFSVWDVLSGRRVVTFRESNQPQAVKVNEEAWRLTVEAEDGSSAGRYRRSVATVWDLATGQRLEKTDAGRSWPGYRDRSAVDGFSEHAVSPDGELHAVAVRTPVGAGVALQVARSDQEVFRAEHPASLRIRMAFTPDGRFLLTNWDSDQRSQVDVWEL